MAGRFGDGLPPLGELVEGGLAAQAVSNQVAPDDGSGAPNAALAVQVGFSAHATRLVEMVENGLHLFGGGQAVIGDGKVMVGYLKAKFIGFVLEQVLVGLTITGAGEVDEGVEAVLKEGGNALAGALWAVCRCGVFASQDFARYEPVGFGDGQHGGFRFQAQD